jgi:diaminohydroxyphosphoribosylaminopyrimidine deaminase/5-amino-6-(5-phosphoribosylamino)uracil reductase
VSDLKWMREALARAASMAGRTAPNPTVGCTIVAGDALVACAATGEGGRPHAEEAALALAKSGARGAAVYVTLEPCARRSSGTPGCAQLLRDAGVARVVVAVRDPHPFAAGAGVELLRAAGIEVATGLLEEEARALNREFLSKWEQS